MLTLTIDRMRIFGIYMPNLKAKIPYWEALIDASRSHSRRHALARSAISTPAVPLSMSLARPTAQRCSWTRSLRPGFAMSGATVFRTVVSFPGTVTAATDFAWITRSPRHPWRYASGISVTHTPSGRLGYRTIPRCCWTSSRRALKPPSRSLAGAAAGTGWRPDTRSMSSRRSSSRPAFNAASRETPAPGHPAARDCRRGGHDLAQHGRINATACSYRP